MVDVTATRDIDLYVITTDKDKYKIYKSYLQDDIIEKNLYDGLSMAILICSSAEMINNVQKQSPGDVL